MMKTVLEYAENPSSVSYASLWHSHLLSQQQQAANTNNPSWTYNGTAVFGLAFVEESWLVGCTDAGQVCIWNISTEIFNEDNEDVVEFWDARRNRVDQDAKGMTTATQSSPVLCLQISESSLHACKVVECKDCTWLVVSGKCGVVVLVWESDVLPLLHNMTKEENHNPQNPKQFGGKFKSHLKPYPSAYGTNKINDFEICGDYLFGASDDAFGLYKWSLETGYVVSTYRDEGSNGCFRSTEILPGSNLLMFGGKDGILHLWDTAKDQAVDSIDVNKCKVSSDGNSSKNIKKKSPDMLPVNNVNTQRWISSCKARDDTWWEVAGGESVGDVSTGGFFTTFHGPTRSIISTVMTRETPHQIAFYKDKTQCTMLSVANESFVSHWDNCLSLCNDCNVPQRQRVRCSQGSAHAVTVSPDSKQIAVGGVGTVVDIFQRKTQYSMELSLF